jgi:two-component system, chemotaxis family, CheB/CheR fusion protein
MAEASATPERSGESAVAGAFSATPNRPCKLVVLGASAGGLDALCRVFERLPPDTGAAFVVVQHLSPDHKTLMDTLLARHTAMPVRLIQQDDVLAANTVLLNPPGKAVHLDGQQLTLSPKPEGGLSLPIDDFFHAASVHWTDRLVAVVLSGTGSDGSRGVARVSAAGGTVLAQRPDTASFDGMPRSAIATGVVDCILDANDIGTWLGEHLPLQLDVPDHGEDTAGLSLAETVVQTLGHIAGAVRQGTAMDLDAYKPDMLLRRIRRRMQLLNIDSLSAYAQHLESAPEEARALRKEVLIPVTRFFRDTEVFDQLRHQVLPELISNHAVDQPLRVWVTACATGEEAYSVAMTIVEVCESLRRWPQIKLYATDLEQRFLDIASAGVYPESIVTEVGADRIERHFTHREGRYTVRPELRAMIVFAQHNLLSDPPFTRMHLVSCRNMLIYLKPTTQELVLRRLHYALLPEGVLLLGRSESLGGIEPLLRAVDSRARIYRMAQGGGGVAEVTSGMRPGTLSARLRPVPPVPAMGSLHPAMQVLTRHFAPPSVLLDDRRQVLHVFGDLDGLLQVRAGHPSLDILDLLPVELTPVVSDLLQHLPAASGPVRSPPVRVSSESSDDTSTVITALTVPGAGGVTAGTLLVFDGSAAARQGVEPVTVLALKDTDQQILQGLQHELDITREALQATIEELETSNEELQATNEELMASNEELQSTNEELQSVNEELYTVNAEYQGKAEMLADLNVDLEGISQATGLPSLFVDEQLRVVRMTPELGRIFQLRATDVGRSITDFSHRLVCADFFDALVGAMRSGEVHEREVRSLDGGDFLMRLVPYGNQRGQGARSRVVATFIDLTEVRDISRLQGVIDAVPANLALLDRAGTITWVNQPWLDFAHRNGVAKGEEIGVGSNYFDVLKPQRGSPSEVAAPLRATVQGLRAVLERESPHFFTQYPCHAPHERRWFAMHVTPLPDSGGALVTHYDVTRWVAPHEEPPDAAEPSSRDAPQP